MNIATLDLEGVLVPEIWIAFAEATNIPQLRLTTRDEPDYDKLMGYRLDILRRHNLGLPEIREVIGTLKPLDGARDFLKWLQSRMRVVILSDTFDQFASALMAHLDYPTLFCHELEVAPNGAITGYRLRMPDQKRKAVEAFRALNFNVIASGDSYNDLSMLRAANRAVLYKPTPQFAADNPDLPVAENYAQLKSEFEKCMQSLANS